MQSMAYDVRDLFRYEQDSISQPNRGGAVAVWRRKERHKVYLYPLESSQARNEFGMTKETLWRAIAHDTRAFRIGERIGDRDQAIYEIIRIRTFKTTQQMEVRELWQQTEPSIYQR